MVLLVHVPPVELSVKAIDEPVQTDVGPDIVPATGSGFTVTPYVAVARPQLFTTVYVAVALPAAMPVTIPPVLIVATERGVMLQEPPVADSVNVIVDPWQTLVGPEIDPATGNGLTATVYVATAVPQVEVTE